MKKFEVTIEIPVEYISDLLCTFAEGGGNTWAHISKGATPKNWNTIDSYAKNYPDSAGKRHNVWDYPLNSGGSWIVYDEEEYQEDGVEAEKYVLNAGKIQKALKMMAKGEGATDEDQKEWLISNTHYFVTNEGDHDAAFASALVEIALFDKITYC